MTVAELRKALEGLPDDMPVVLGYDGMSQNSGNVADIRIIPSEDFPMENNGPWLLIPEEG